MATSNPRANIDNPFNILDDVKFWGKQVAEHMLFINLGLVDREIQRQQLNPALYNDSMYLYGQWYNLTILNSPNQGNLRSIEALLLRTLDYQKDVKAVQASGKWIGWLSDSFYAHLNLESNYFLTKIRGTPFDIESELSFWLHERKTDTAATLKLIDPTEKQWEEEAWQAIKVLGDLEKNNEVNDDDLARLSLHAFNELNGFYNQLGNAINHHTVKTTIHPLLAEHVKREGERAIQTLQWYLNK